MSLSSVFCAQVTSRQAFARLIHRSAPLDVVKPFLLADIGEGIAEVELVEWFVKEGDPIKQFDRLCEVQSDKANVEISSRFDGVVKQLSHKAGDIARVGDPLLLIEVEGEEEEEENTSTKQAAPAAAPAAPATPPPAPAAAAASIAPPASVASASAQQSQTAARSGKVLTTPAVRHIARNHDLDLTLVTPTGPHGRILKGDVLAFIESGGSAAAQEAPAAPAAAAADRVEPIRGIKRMMVQSMKQSLAIPHFVYSDEFEMGAVSAVRKQVNDVLATAPTGPKKMSYMPLIIKAASLALEDYPILNSSISDDEQEIIYRGSHNIGVAMDTPAGLLVPNIKNVQALSLEEISDELVRLQEAGSIGKLSQEDQSGTTFSLSNIGAIGGTYTSPVIARPQVAIGALGKIQKLPRFDDEGNVVAAEIMAISWAADHRIIDGATVARFSNQMKAYLEDPLAMLLKLR